MNNPLSFFYKNLDNINSLACIHLYFQSNRVETLEYDEILRAEFVLLVSAFDHYIHEIVKEGMLNIFEGTKPTNKNFENFSIPLKILNLIMNTESVTERKAILDGEIKKITSKDSYQAPTSVEKALSIIDLNGIWTLISYEMNDTPKNIKDRLALIVNRRNKIAHESDFDTISSTKNYIDRELVDETKKYICDLVLAINSKL